jgi:HAD superfamily hydrolase (TIGR01662 family)
MNNYAKYRLIIFDADGTLIDRDSSEFLPGVEEWFKRSGHDHLLAIATNQGGPACRDAGWGEKYPTLAEVEGKYGSLAEVLGAKLFMSLCFPVRGGGYIAPRGLPSDDPRTLRSWRKPAPGMLIAAMIHYGVEPDDTLMVGDRPEDYLAAEAAGVDFHWAYQFFERVK